MLKFEGEGMQQKVKPQQNDPRMDALLDWFVDNWAVLTRAPSNKSVGQQTSSIEPVKNIRSRRRKKLLGKPDSKSKMNSPTD